MPQVVRVDAVFVSKETFGDATFFDNLHELLIGSFKSSPSKAQKGQKQ
jgi:hypothetical protein